MTCEFMTCTSCLLALQRPAQADYRTGCLGCQIRKLVHMPGEQRAAMLDRIQHVHGYGARAEAARLIEIEAARIKKLRAAQAGRVTV